MGAKTHQCTSIAGNPLCVGDSFLIHIVHRPSNGGGLPDFLPNREELVESVKVEGNLDDTDHEMIRVQDLKGRRAAGEEHWISARQTLTNSENWWDPMGRKIREQKVSR